MPQKSSVEEQAFLNGIKENLHKSSALERLGFEPEMSCSRDDVQVITAKIIKALTTYFSDLPECKDLIVQIKEAEVAAIKEMDIRVEVPRVFSSEPPMPETEGWKLRTEPSLMNKSLHRLSSPIWVVLGLLLFIAVCWKAYSPRSPKNDNNTDTKHSASSRFSTSVNDTLQTNPSNRPIWQREDPSKKWAEPVTPATRSAQTASTIVENVRSFTVVHSKEAIRSYENGDDPNLLLLDYAKDGDVGGMREMLAKGADPNYCRQRGRWERPLMLAAGSGSISAVKYLLQQPSIDIFAEDKDYQTARTYTNPGSSIDRLLASMGLHP